MKGSFADRVRDVFRKRPDKGVANEEIAVELDLFGKGRTPLCKVLDDLIQAGEITRVEPGVHQWANKPRPAQLREVMWRLIRARKVVSVDDLMELSGAGEEYVKEYLRMLVKRGIVRKVQGSGLKPVQGSGKYQLVKDEGIAAPEDRGKAEKLRAIRRKKAEALEALDNAFMAITQARMAITEISNAD
jgi:hypothetical protein